MADIEWIKFHTDMFDNRKIKYIRALPEGNNVLLIWIMLLSMAGRCNSNGYIFLTETMPYTLGMLAKELGFELSVVELALNQLVNLNMIQIEHSNIYICNWCKYQNIDGMEKIKLQNAKRQQKFRDKQKQLLISNVTSNVTVTENNATDKNKIRIDKEVDKELLLQEKSCGDSGSLQLKDVFINYENEVGLISPTIKETFESYQTEITAELMILAIKTAVKSNARRLSYIEGILKNWVNDSIHTVDELKAKELEKNSRSKYTTAAQTKVEKFNSMASHDWDFDELEKLQRERITKMVNAKERG